MPGRFAGRDAAQRGDGNLVVCRGVRRRDEEARVQPVRTRILSQRVGVLFLCLSRACLGETIIFKYKVRFLTDQALPR